jgi:hypothetical protein
VYKSELPLHCIDDVRRNPAPADIFYVMGRSKLRQQSIDLLPCRVGCEFITITISIARREAAENFLSSAVSIGSHHTIAELAQCSLINCWSHVQNVTRGPWPSMQGTGDGRRKRPWSDLPAPSVVIRKKSVLAALTTKDRVRSSTKLAVVVSKVHCLRVATSGVEHDLAMGRLNFPG